MIAATEASVEILSELIQMNDDRVKGFTRALKNIDSSNGDLKSIFENYINQSKIFSNQLIKEAVKVDSDYSPDDISFTGSTHRAWMDVKSIFTGDDRKSLLQECERGEDSIRKAYQNAIRQHSELSEDQISLINKQLSEIQDAHDKIRTLRDTSQ